ncbi:hypothetical protein HX875_10910 [Pseudomonas yamanorum]|uniref:Uncharacterized protein n=1 Tax=Pseudomonas yamanorum TaxID=515393 RepID=A0A7Y8K4D4_9PSED|nr:MULTISPECIES: hypothetical protein [Pseudomonas]MCS3414896.1 hypothetical protein [Pseudomonas sp. BIGb0558]MCS3435601.1 hypothetical protein [Pseudomonas sp. BIGb0450]NVZ80799.1 hypothetical protein [Pseudomonas yamanorum]NWE16106.1 hypothetical protein [Pseudomonas yamanorum]NWE39979.1 hypothetical protein [Pseudomonas yamanorum]
MLYKISVFYKKPGDGDTYKREAGNECWYDHPILEVPWYLFNVLNQYHTPALNYSRNENNGRHSEYALRPSFKVAMTKRVPVSDYKGAVLHIALSGIELFVHGRKDDREAEQQEGA